MHALSMIIIKIHEFLKENHPLSTYIHTVILGKVISHKITEIVCIQICLQIDVTKPQNITKTRVLGDSFFLCIHLY